MAKKNIKVFQAGAFLVLFLAIPAFIPSNLLGVEPLNALDIPQEASATRPFQPALLVALKAGLQDPLHFEFFVKDEGKAGVQQDHDLLVKDFLTGLAIPEKDFWVDLCLNVLGCRTMEERFALTATGGSLFLQGQALHRLAMALLDPQTDVGGRFWDACREAHDGPQTISSYVPVLNRIKIIPDMAEVYQQGMFAVVTKSRLKVVLDEGSQEMGEGVEEESRRSFQKAFNKSFREIIIPLIEKEVNEGADFARLRQIYNALILAAWYKQAFPQGAFATAYVDRSKVAGIAQTDPTEHAKLYQQYLEDSRREDLLVQQHFSGGFFALGLAGKIALHQGALPARSFSGSFRKVCVDLQQVMGEPYPVYPENDLKRLRKFFKEWHDPSRKGELSFDLKAKMLQPLLQEQAYHLFDIFMIWQEAQDPDKDSWAKTRQIAEALFFSVTDSWSSAQELVFSGDQKHINAVFYEILAVAKLARDPGRVPYKDILDHLGLEKGLNARSARIVSALSGPQDLEAFYQDIFNRFNELNTMFKDPGFDELTRLDGVRWGDSFWGMTEAKKRGTTGDVEKAIEKEKAYLDTARDFVDTVVGDSQISIFKTTLEGDLSKRDSHGRKSPHPWDLAGARVIVDAGLSGIEQQAFSLKERSMKLSDLQAKVASRSVRISDDLDVKNKVWKRSRRSQAGPQVKLKEKKKQVGTPVLVTFENKYMENDRNGYARSFNFRYMLGIEDWTVDIQVKTLNAAIAQDLALKVFYDNAGGKFLAQDQVVQLNQLVNIVEALNYLFDPSRLGPEKVAEFLDDRAATLLAGAGNVQGSGDPVSVRGFNEHDPVDILAGFSPVIRSVAPADRLFSQD